MKDLHVTVSDATMNRLANLAIKLETSRNALIREAIDAFVTRKEREAVAAEMNQYAREMAPHSGELVRESGDEVTRCILESTEW